jgi:hypothetical protein
MWRLLLLSVFCLVLPCLNAYSLDLFGIRVYPFAQGERRLTTFFPAPLEGTEIKKSVMRPYNLINILVCYRLALFLADSWIMERVIASVVYFTVRLLLLLCLQLTDRMWKTMRALSSAGPDPAGVANTLGGYLAYMPLVLIYRKHLYAIYI